jgi:hypothetical protein
LHRAIEPELEVEDEPGEGAAMKLPVPIELDCATLMAPLIATLIATLIDVNQTVLTGKRSHKLAIATL